MKKIKHIKTKTFFASHPLYDTMSKLCNPSGEDCGAFHIYNDIIFNMDSVCDQYYDENGQLTETVYVRGLNQQEEYWTVHKTKYKDGKPISESEDFQSERIEDEHGNTIEYKTFDENGAIVTRQKYKLSYNEQGLIQKREHLLGFRKGRYSIYEYNDRRLLSVSYDYLKDGSLSWKFINFYDEQGQLIRREEEFYGDDFEGMQDTPKYTLISVFTREYDEEGHCILEYLKCEDGLQPDELTVNEIEYAE